MSESTFMFLIIIYLSKKGSEIMTSVFEQKNPFKVYLQMAVPLVLSSLVSMIYNIADTYFIAYAQDASLVAGVSLCGPLMTLLMAFGNLMAQGGSSLLSRLLGEKDVENVKRICSFCFYTAIGIGLFFIVILLIFQKPLLTLLGADSDTMSAAYDYYKVIAVGSPLIILSFVPTNMLRSEGLSKEMMVASLLGTIVNLILDPLFILAMGLGSFGAALATVIGFVCSIGYCIYVICRKSQVFSIRISDYRCSLTNVKDILAIGLSAAITNILMAISQAMYNNAFLAYGSDKIAALGIALKIFYLPFMIIVGFAYGAQPVFGYFYGAKDFEKLTGVLKKISAFLIALAAIFTVLVISTSSFTIPLFLEDPEIVATGKTILFWQSITLVATSILLVVMILLQSMGKARHALIISLTRQGVVFMIVLQICRIFFGYSGIIRTQAISDVIAAVIAILLLLSVRNELWGC